MAKPKLIDSQPAERPTRLQGNARAFLKAAGYEPSDWTGARTAKSFLQDFASACEDCGDWYADQSNLWSLSDRWGDRKFCCWSCACEAGQYGWRAA